MRLGNVSSSLSGAERGEGVVLGGTGFLWVLTVFEMRGVQEGWKAGGCEGPLLLLCGDRIEGVEGKQMMSHFLGLGLAASHAVEDEASGVMISSEGKVEARWLLGLKQGRGKGCLCLLRDGLLPDFLIWLPLQYPLIFQSLGSNVARLDLAWAHRSWEKQISTRE
jgi:hypothetical protein